MLKLLLLTLCGYLVAGTGNQGLPPPFTCTTTTTLCRPGETNHLSPESASNIHFGRPGKYSIRGPKGEKGDSCGCGDGHIRNNLPHPTVGHGVAVNGTKGSKGEPGRSTAINQPELDVMRNKIAKLESDVRKLQNSASTTQVETVGENSVGLLSEFPTRCSDLKAGSVSDLGRAVIYPLISFFDITPYVVNCSDGGWITIQRRTNGSENFYRTWREYADGFGNKSGEFWLGLKTIHRLTSQRPYELYIHMKRKDNGAPIYARYGVFFVDNEASKFRLVVGDYSGNYSDNMSYHNGLRFTTHDKDLDENSSNCAQTYKGAWWYKNCHRSNLNGQYNGYLYFGISLSYVEMKIRPRC